MLLQLLQRMTRGRSRRRGPADEFFGRGAAAPVQVIVLRPGSRQGRSAARIPSGPVLLLLVLRRVESVAAALLFDGRAADAAADGRPAVALVVVVDGLPVAGQRLVRLAFGPRLVLLRVTAAVRRRLPRLHRARRRFHHWYLAGLMLHAVSAAATGLVRRLGAAAAAVLVLAVVEVLVQVQVVVAVTGHHRRRRYRQRDLR